MLSILGLLPKCSRQDGVGRVERRRLEGERMTRSNFERGTSTSMVRVKEESLKQERLKKWTLQDEGLVRSTK